MLGTTIDLYELNKASQGNSDGSSTLDRYMNIPLLMAVAPELFNNVFEDYKNKVRSFNAGGSNSKTPTVEIGNLSTKEAKNLLLGLNMPSGE